MTDTSADVRFTIVADAKIDQVQALANSFQTLQERVDALNGKLGALGNAGQQAAQATTALTQAKATTTKATEQLATALGKGNEGLKTFIQHTGLATGGTGQFGQALSALSTNLGPVGAGVAALTATVAGLTVGLAEAGKAAQHNRQLLQSLMDVSGQGGGYSSVIAQLKELRVEAGLVGASMDDLVKSFRSEFAESGGNVAQVMEQVKVSLKVAAVAGQDFGAAFDTIGKALDGNLRALRQYGIYLSENQQTALKAMSDNDRFASVMKILHEQYKEGSQATDSYARSQKELNAKLGELRNTLTPQALEIMTAWNKGLLQMATDADKAAKSVGTLAGAFGNLGNALKLGELGAAFNAGYAGSSNALGTGGLVDALRTVGLAGGGPVGAIMAAPRLLGGTGDLAGGLAGAINAATGYNPATAGVNAGGGFGDTYGPILPNPVEFAEQKRLEAIGKAKADADTLKKQIEESATRARKARNDDYDHQAQQARDTLKQELERIATREKEEIASLDRRRKAGDEAIAADRTAEQDRYQEEVRLIGLREKAELAAIETRKTAEAEAHRERLQQIADDRDTDLRSLDERKTANLKQIDGQRDAENARYTALREQRQDEDRATQRSFQDRTEAARRAAEEAKTAEEKRRDAVLEGYKQQRDALEAAHKADLAGIEATLKAAQVAHDDRVRQIKDEAAAREDAIKAQIRGIDEAKAAREYAIRSEADAYKYGQAQDALAKARRDGASPEEIARLERAVFEARLKEAETFANEQDRLLKETLQSELDQNKRRADERVQVENDLLKATQDTESARRDEITRTYQARVDTLAQAEQAERAASTAALGRISDRLKAATDAIGVEQRAAEDARTNRDREDQKAHEAALARIATARENTEKQYAIWQTAIRDTAEQKIRDENKAYTQTEANFKNEIDLVRDRYSSEKEGGERYEASKTHKQVMDALDERKKRFDADMDAERQKITNNADQMRHDTEQSWGDVPGGKLRAINDAREAAQKSIDKIVEYAKTIDSAAEGASQRLNALYLQMEGISKLHLPSFVQYGGGADDPGGAASVGLPTTPNGGIAVNRGPTMTPAQINEAVKGTVLDGQGQAIYDLGVKYNVDPGFFVSVAKTESDFGRAANSPVGQTYNFGSISYYGGAGQLPTPPGVGSSRFASYPTPVAGVEAFYQLVAGEYYSQGQTDTASIYNGVNGQHAYAPVWDNNASALPNLHNQYRQYASPRGTMPVSNALNWQTLAPNQFNVGLTEEEAKTACGPTAAAALARFYGDGAIPVSEVFKYASLKGYHTGAMGGQGYMRGYQKFQELASDMGIDTTAGQVDWGQVQQRGASHLPTVISRGGTSGHYYVVTGYDRDKGYYVGETGKVVGQGEWIKQQQFGSDLTMITPTGGKARRPWVPGATRGAGTQRGIYYGDDYSGPEGYFDTDAGGSPWAGDNPADLMDAANDLLPSVRGARRSPGAPGAGGPLPVFVTNWPAGGLSVAGGGGAAVGGGSGVGGTRLPVLVAKADGGVTLVHPDALKPGRLGGLALDDDGTVLRTPRPGAYRSGPGPELTTGNRRLGGIVSDGDVVAPDRGGAPADPGAAGGVPGLLYGRRTAADWQLTAVEQLDPAIKSVTTKWNQWVEVAEQSNRSYVKQLGDLNVEILRQQASIEEGVAKGTLTGKRLQAEQEALASKERDRNELVAAHSRELVKINEAMATLAVTMAEFRAGLRDGSRQLGILATSANAAMMGLGPTGPMGPQISSKPFGTWDQIKAFNDKFGPRVGNPFDMLPGENPLQWQEQALLSALGLNYYGMKFGDNENASSAIAKINRDLTHQSGTAFGGGIANDPMGASDPGIKVAGAAGRGAVVNKPGLWKIAENPGDVEVIFNLSNPGTWWNVIAQTAAMGGAGRLAPLADAITVATGGAGTGSADSAAVGNGYVPPFASGAVATLPGAGGNYSALATRPLLPRLGGPLPSLPPTTINVAMQSPELPPIAVPVQVTVQQGSGGQITASATAQAQWLGGGSTSSTSASFGGGGGSSVGAAPLSGALRGAGGLDPQSATLLGAVGNWQPFDRAGVGDLRN